MVGGGGSGKGDGSELGVGYLEWRLRDTEIPHRVVVGRVEADAGIAGLRGQWRIGRAMRVARAGPGHAAARTRGPRGAGGGAPSPPPPAPPLFAGSGPRGPRLSPHPWIPQRGGARRLARPHIPLRQLRGTYQPRGRPQRGPGLRDPGRSDGGPGAMFPWRLVPEAAVAAAAAPAAGGRADPPSRAPSSASSTSSSRRAAALPRGGGRGGEGGGAGTRGRADQPRSLPPPSRAMAAVAAAALRRCGGGDTSFLRPPRPCARLRPSR